MKYFVILLILLGFIAISSQHADGTCVSGTDWDKVPCESRTCFGSEPPAACTDPNWWKKGWAPYYDYKGTEWMNQKKIELLDAIKTDTLTEWMKLTPNGANSNVHDYYFYMGEIPNHNGIYVKQYFAGYFPPLKQYKTGSGFADIKCKDSLTLVTKYDGSPACVKHDTKSKLIERGWARETSENILSSKSLEILTVEELLIQNQIDYLPDKLVVTGGPTIQGDPGCGAVIDMDSNTHWFSIDSISNPKNMTLYSENPGMCKANESSCFCNAQIELTALTLKELSYFTIEDQEKYSNILIDYLGKENINRTPKFVIGKLNLNYTDSSTIGYCGKMWGENDYGFFRGAIVNDKVMGYGVDKKLPLLCAISTDTKYFGKAFGENEN